LFTISQYFAAFGQQPQQQTSIFGATNTTGTTSLFGAQQPATAFGAAKPQGFGFGQPQQPSTSLFSSTPAQPQQSSLFGQAGATSNAGGGLFGASATGGFGQQPQASQQGGTAIAKFLAPQETDTLMKGSTTSYVQTKQQCITFMKEYAEKSLEELRFEDYAANRKGPQAGAGMFGAQQQTPGVFGSTMQQPAAGSMFGAQQTQPQTTGLFGSAVNTMGGGELSNKIIRNRVIKHFIFRRCFRSTNDGLWSAGNWWTLWETTPDASYDIIGFHCFRIQHFDVRRSETVRASNDNTQQWTLWTTTAVSVRRNANKYIRRCSSIRSTAASSSYFTLRIKSANSSANFRFGCNVSSIDRLRLRTDQHEHW
jgi:hypothetical protein